MEEKDTIIVKNQDGIDEEVELVLTVDKKEKKYLLYRDKNDELFASYIVDGDDLLHDDLTDEEYDMLEKIYLKGNEIYDK